MSGVVIVGYEGSERSNDALALGEALAAADDAHVVVACVHPLQPLTSAIGEAGFDREVRAGAQRTAERARKLLARADEAEFTAVLGVSPADGLAGLAVQRGASAVLVGSSKRGAIGRVLCGTLAERLVRAARCAVGVAPAEYARAPRTALSRFGAAFDGSQQGEEALHLAERLAARFRRRLRVIAVAGSEDPDEPLAALLKEAIVATPVSVHAEGVLRRGDPVHELAVESEDLDLLVCGSRGLGRARRLVLGSVSSGLMRAARCPILVAQRAQ